SARIVALPTTWRWRPARAVQRNWRIQMGAHHRSRVLFVGAAAALAMVMWAPRLTADHNWGKYHWERSQNPLKLNIGDNLSGSWSSYLQTAVSDWSFFPLALTGVPGKSASPDCAPTLGRVEVCNGAYGNNGWLGIAQIWAGRGSHIVQGTTK